MLTPDLTVDQLRAAIGRLLDAVEARFGPDLHLKDDHYWNAPLREAADLSREPKLDMGSVVDDAASVREFIKASENDCISIWHEADHIAGVLRSIARLDLHG